MALIALITHKEYVPIVSLPLHKKKKPSDTLITTHWALELKEVVLKA